MEDSILAVSTSVVNEHSVKAVESKFATDQGEFQRIVVIL